MLFINISSDMVNIEIGKEKIKLNRNEIENTIGPKLVELYREYKFDKIFVLNGPGGFTNLRVGTLAINLLNTLEQLKIDIFSISKIDFFKYFVKKDILTKKGIIYIGQKQNVRLYDFVEQKQSVIKKNDINYDQDLFLDQVYDENYFEKETIKISSDKNNIILNFGGKDYISDIGDLGIKVAKTISANYFIQPTMGGQ